MPGWNFRQFGSASDPVHKSHLNAITGDYGCPKQFRYAMDARAARGETLDERDTVPGKAAAGTAAHETIARALTQPAAAKHLLAGGSLPRDRVRDAFRDEMAREVGSREVRWYDEDATEYCEERVTMIVALLADLHKHVAEIVLVEPGFVAPLERYWLSGHVDLLYRPRSAPHKLALADWKTGAHKPAELDLDHGWEAGVYSAAVARGLFVPRHAIGHRYDAERAVWSTWVGDNRHVVTHASRYIAERETLERALVEIAQARNVDSCALGHVDADSELLERVLGKAHGAAVFAEFPSEVYCVHMADYVPYKKAGKKALKRPEDLAFFGYDKPVKAHAYTAGQQRGPAWLPVKLTEYDLPRLESRLRNVIGMIRMGCFVDQVGERCNRCAYSSDCLTGGYGPRGSERDELERGLRVVDSDGRNASSLSVEDD